MLRLGITSEVLSGDLVSMLCEKEGRWLRYLVARFADVKNNLHEIRPDTELEAGVIARYARYLVILLLVVSCERLNHGTTERSSRV